MWAHAMIIGTLCVVAPIARAQKTDTHDDFRVALIGVSLGSPDEQEKAVQVAGMLGVEGVLVFEPQAHPPVTTKANAQPSGVPVVGFTIPGVSGREGLAVIGLATSAQGSAGVCTEIELAQFRDTLQSLKADQIFIAVDRAVWADMHRQEAWGLIHEVLIEDPRVLAVFAVSSGIQRDDGIRDGIRYLGLPPSSGVGPRGLEQFSKPGIVVIEGGGQQSSLTITVVDPSAVSPITSTMGSVVDEAISLRDAVTVQGAFGVSVQGGAAGSVSIEITNPTTREIRYAMSLNGPAGWSFSRDQISGTLTEDQSVTVEVSAASPEFSKRPEIEVRGLLRLPLDNSDSQSVPVTVNVPVRPMVQPQSPGHGVLDAALVLEGRGAVRIDQFKLPDAYTIEFWALSDGSLGGSVLLSAPGVQLNWSNATDPEPQLVAVLSQAHESPLVITSEVVTPRERWVHVALCVGSDSASLFLDGQLQGSRPMSLSEGARGVLVLGGVVDVLGAVRSGFTGSIDSLRISSAVLYTQAFTPSRAISLGDHTQLLMRYDRDFGVVVADDSGHDHHGWRVGQAEIKIEQAAGARDGAAADSD